nr:substrate-binding domain-containing protein [Entomospira culicis]
MLAGIESTKESDLWLTDQRYIAFRTLAEPLGLFNPQWIIQAPFHVQDGYQAMQEFLQHTDNLPTIFFASSDALAIGAIQALQEEGIKIPQEISIIGFNDISVAQYVTPALTTIKVHTHWMGGLALDHALRLLQDASPIAQKIMLATELKVRDSTAPA